MTDPAEVEHPLTLERWSPPQHTSYDVFLGARGDVVVMQNRISRDAGATWSALPADLGAPMRVAITGSTVVTYSTSRGLVRWDLASDAITDVAGEPGFASERSWRADPAGKLLAFDQVGNAIAVERGTWVTSSLPQPTPTDVNPYIQDLESNGQVMLTTSTWGIHRSVDGATWTLVTANVPNAGRDLVVLADGRFALVGGAVTYVFDAQGNAAGTKPSFNVADGDAMACDDGSIVARGKLTRDVGMSWQKLVPDTLDMVIERSGCGGGRYWALARSSYWGYRLVRFDASVSEGIVAGNWEASEGSWQINGPSIVRRDDGGFLVAGMAWRDGADWSLRESPSQIWASSDHLFGASDAGHFLSVDGGSTWKPLAQEFVAPEAFANADGLYVAGFSADSNAVEDRWHSVVWHSTDDGATWSTVYDQSASRPSGQEPIGEAHRFVGIVDGTWISTDAISKDQGVTWEATEATGDRSLAFLTRGGSLVTTLPASSPKEDIWRVYANGGMGPLLATHRIEVDGVPVPASSLRSIAFDDEGYVYVARGAPYVQIWRSKMPVEAPAIP